MSEIQKRLVHLFQIYPVLSPTMIQAFLGGKMPPRFWKPVMEEMIEEGTLIRTEVISENIWGQLHSHTCIRLADHDS